MGIKVSVCMATYNGGKYINQQIASILKQLEKEDELLISDDHSTDNTLSIIQEFNDSRIKVYKNSVKNNLIKNFNNVLSYATGDIILLADQDDIWMENKVHKFKQTLQKYDLALSDCTIVDENLNVLFNSRFAIDRCKKGAFNNIIKNNYMGCCMGFKREILNKALPFPDDIPMHDMWIGIIADIYFKVKIISEPLIYYRRHNQNASLTSTKSTFSILKKFEFRYLILKNLIKLKWKAFNI